MAEKRINITNEQRKRWLDKLYLDLEKDVKEQTTEQREELGNLVYNFLVNKKEQEIFSQLPASYFFSKEYVALSFGETTDRRRIIVPLFDKPLPFSLSCYGILNNYFCGELVKERPERAQQLEAIKEKYNDLVDVLEALYTKIAQLVISATELLEGVKTIKQFKETWPDKVDDFIAYIGIDLEKEPVKKAEKEKIKKINVAALNEGIKSLKGETDGTQENVS